MIGEFFGQIPLPSHRSARSKFASADSLLKTGVSAVSWVEHSCGPWQPLACQRLPCIVGGQGNYQPQGCHFQKGTGCCKLHM